MTALGYAILDGFYWLHGHRTLRGLLAWLTLVGFIALAQLGGPIAGGAVCLAVLVAVTYGYTEAVHHHDEADAS